MAAHLQPMPMIGSRPAPSPSVAVSDWKRGLPVLQANGITLRELRISDAPALLALLTTDEVTRFISPPPTTIEGFERFIRWAERESTAGRYVFFAVVPD
jgi:RimJ/RimL family protein N-acetyltransferase